MPMKKTELSAAAPARRSSAPAVTAAALPRPPRPLPSTGAVRVLQSRLAPAQRSLFQHAPTAR